MKPTHLDLFSGIGGFALACEAQGFQTIGFCEIDDYAGKVLKQHWPHIPNYGDITTFNAAHLGPVDLITAGFPCQPFSYAGNRLGTGDERHLWPALCRVIGQVRPRFALLENVPALLSIDGGRTFGRILSDLAEIGFGCSWNCVPASAIGALHSRDRLWIVAHSHSPGRQELHPAAFPNHPRLTPRPLAQGWDLWGAEPVMGRVAHGVPQRMDRLKAIGNAIVPQVAQIFARAIHRELTSTSAILNNSVVKYSLITPQP